MKQTLLFAMVFMACREQAPAAGPPDAGAPVVAPAPAAPAADMAGAPAALLEDAEALGVMPTGAAPALKLGGGKGLPIMPEDGVLRLDDGALVRDVPAGARAFAPLDDGAAQTTYLYEGERHVATLTRAAWEPGAAGALPPEVAPIPAEAEERARFEGQDGEAGAGRVVRLVSQAYVYTLAMREGVSWPLTGLVLLPPTQHTCLDDEGCPRRWCACGEGGGGPFVASAMRCGEESLCVDAEATSCEERCAGR